MDLGLQRRVALVTGGSRGIGRAIAETLAAEGARVAVAARSADGVRAVAEAIGGRGYVFDSSDLAGVDPLVDAVEGDLGPIDIYVANTGGPPRDSDPLAFSAEQWETAHRTLVVAPMLVLARVVPGMRERGFGRVVAVSSSAAVEPIGGLQLSNVNRPGLLAGFKLLARENAAHGVTFNAVLPGRIATDRLVSVYGSLEAAEEAAGSEVPRGGSERRRRPRRPPSSCAPRPPATSPASGCSWTGVSRGPGEQCLYLSIYLYMLVRVSTYERRAGL